MDANTGNRGRARSRGVTVREGIQGLDKPRTVTSDEIRATLTHHVANYGPREAGQRAQSNLSRYHPDFLK